MSEVLQAEKWLHQKEADHEVWNHYPCWKVVFLLPGAWAESPSGRHWDLSPTQLESRLIWCGRDSRLHTSLTSSLFELLSPSSEPLCLHHVFFPWEEKHSSDHHHLISFPLFSPPMATFFYLLMYLIFSILSLSRIHRPLWRNCFQFVISTNPNVTKFKK